MTDIEFTDDDDIPFCKEEQEDMDWEEYEEEE